MTWATPLFRQPRGVKFGDGKVFPALPILNGSEGPGAAPVVRAVAMTLAVQALTSMALAVPAVLAPVAAGDFGEAPTAVGGRPGTPHPGEPCCCCIGRGRTVG